LEQQVARLFFKVNRGVRAFWVKDKIVSFMLPLGYSFNLDGSMMYMTLPVFS
jgi:Na+/H+-dicarboxylate symporter